MNQEEVDKDQVFADKALAVSCHIAGLLGNMCIPFVGSILIPLIITEAASDPKKPLLGKHGREATNFQMSITLYVLIGTIGWTAALFFCIDNRVPESLFVTVSLAVAFLLASLLFTLEISCVIIAAVKACQGKDFKYPLRIRFLKEK